ncbi:MAG: DUF3810 domain-containing protein [Dysgonamonadaceae bacterium]|nr:DUF3810 domain-containing protein [Dysgonamonadaceae bacterium]
MTTKSQYIKYTIPLTFLVFIFLCSRTPTLAEWYMRVFYPPIATGLSFFSRLIPFSLLDIPLIVAIILIPASIVMLCMRKWRFFRWTHITLLSILWIVVWFYMAWGISYFRPGFHERFGIEIPKEDKAFFETFVERYIVLLNESYIPNPYFNTQEIDAEIEKLFAKHHEMLRLPYPNGWRHNKRTLTELLMDRMGIAGYFNPFFSEIQVNMRAPILTFPYTLAHEKAHQFGIAHEDECNLIATIICTSSTHPLVRYSGYLQTVRYLLGNLQTISPDRYQEIVAQIDSRIMADYRAIREHWQQSIDPTLSAMQERVYDAYLRANQQQSGILSYSEMVRLLIAWEMSEL